MNGENKLKKLFLSIALILMLAGSAFAKDSKKVKVDVLAKTGLSWNGETLLAYSSGKPEITILRIEIPPGVKLPRHEHPVINAGVLLKGELTVITDKKKTLHLKAGDSIVEVVNTWHYGINEGNLPAEIIVFYAGVEGSPITVKE